MLLEEVSEVGRGQVTEEEEFEIVSRAKREPVELLDHGGHVLTTVVVSDEAGSKVFCLFVYSK